MSTGAEEQRVTERASLEGLRERHRGYHLCVGWGAVVPGTLAVVFYNEGECDAGRALAAVERADEGERLRVKDWPRVYVHPVANLDLDTLAYVRESMVGIEAAGGTINPIALIDSIVATRAEVRGESPENPDFAAASSETGSVLDVERLARALHDSGCRRGVLCGAWGHRDRAQRIAREYEAPR